MAEQARQGVDMARSEGLWSGRDPHDLEPGRAAVQVNLTTGRAGEMVVRNGLIELSFDEI